MSARQSIQRSWGIIGSLLLVVCTASGCRPPDWSNGGHQGPGHRRQPLRLTPSQELSLGRQAYAEILAKAKEQGILLPDSDPRVQRVRQVGQKIRQAASIKPLQREINLDLANNYFDWRFNVIKSPQINAFCLPGCEVAVFTGLLEVATNDSQLAAVIGHEVAHALAHHANERLARANELRNALNAVGGKSLESLNPRAQEKLIGLLAGPSTLYTKAFDRRQESEADHIGIFLMKFAGYDPRQALVFWEKMRRISARRPQPPAILSTHPSDAQRIAQIKRWIPYANAAWDAYESGNVVKRLKSSVFETIRSSPETKGRFSWR